MALDNITSPTLLLQQKTAVRNLDRMLARAQRHGLLFRPHFKTLQSRAVGRMLRERGVRAITVSSVQMAEYFAGDGWDDITIAFPANVREMAAIDRLGATVQLNLLVVNRETVEALASQLTRPVGIFLKIDVGTHRTGLAPGNGQEISAVLGAIEAAEKLNFRGFLAHAGHSYDARSVAEILAVHEETTGILRQLKKEYAGKHPDLLLSTGDTPTCSVAESWDGIDEIRPGNFIFYDLMQVQIGSCQMADIAVAMACPVVAKHPDRREIVVHGGGIHLSKDRMEWDGRTIFGLPVLLNEEGWEMPAPGCYVSSLSQEHGIIRCSDTFFEQIKIGDLLGVLPVHSCMPVNLADRLVTTDGKIFDVM